MKVTKDLPTKENVFTKQREREAMLDGKSKMGADHGEFPAMKGSLKAAGAFLDKCDSLDDFNLQREYPKDKKGVNV